MGYVMPSPPSLKWTNTSVRRFAAGHDPVEVISDRVRETVISALQEGWNGPPYDPFKLADILGIKVEAKEEVTDARLVARGTKPVIEFNPNRPRARVRFSIAHEIAHSLFDDYAQAPRNRLDRGSEPGDGWQVELLCNIAASELLIPAGNDLNPVVPPDVDNLIHIQTKYDLSMEAVAIRIAKTTTVPCVVAVASRVGETDDEKGYRIDYSVASRSSSVQVAPGEIVRGTVFSQCTAVGFTAKGVEQGAGRLPAMYWECVGIAPYLGSAYPRVLGMARASGPRPGGTLSMTLLRGSALEPRGSGPRIIAQIVNDATPTWGAGFSRAVRTMYPDAQESFRAWILESRRNLSLGRIHVFQLAKDLFLASMVAQHGFGPSVKPRVRYEALRKCLDELASVAKEKGASLHIPRIGTGYGGGNWTFITELIDQSLVREGVPVTVYTLPGEEDPERMPASERSNPPGGLQLEHWSNG